MARTGRVDSKAGRNERRKLVATLLNNLAVASLLAGLLQPALAILRSRAAPSTGDGVAALVFILIASTFHLTAQFVVRRLED